MAGISLIAPCRTNPRLRSPTNGVSQTNNQCGQVDFSFPSPSPFPNFSSSLPLAWETFYLAPTLHCFSNSRWRPEQPMGISTRPAEIRLHCRLAARSFDFEITRMISDQVAVHSVQLPLLINYFKMERAYNVSSISNDKYDLRPKFHLPLY